MDIFSKDDWNDKFLKIRPVGADLFYAGWQTDGRTGVTKFIIAFRDFSRVTKIAKHVNEHLSQKHLQDKYYGNKDTYKAFYF